MNIELKRVFKNFILKVLRFFHSSSGLNNLSISEKKGYINWLSSAKFIIKTNHDLPFSNGLTVRGQHFRCNDPFCKALKINDGKIEKDIFINTIFKELIIQKEMKVKDFLPVQKNFKYRDYPVYSITFPWNLPTYESFSSNYLDMVLDNRKEYTENTGNIASIFIYSKDYVYSHFSQFNELFESIKKKGFNTELERPRVVILKNSNRWKWMMSGQGNHRAYICSMMSYENLPCEIINVVDRAKAKSWPNVVNGTYTKEHALEIFDLIFSGKHIFKGIV